MPQRSPTIRRWTLKLALCLLAGAVVTWGVAWGCALWGLEPATSFQRTSFQPGGFDTPWKALAPARSMGDTGWIHGSTRLRTRTIFVSGLDDADLPKSEGGTVDEFGWPARAMFALKMLDKNDQIARDTFVAPISILRPGPHCPGLPTQVLPLGFALNTLLAAGVLLGVVEGFAFARRRARVRNGRCPSCGYGRGGLAGDAAACPECGAQP
jgi:hypothetical protein